MDKQGSNSWKLGRLAVTVLLGWCAGIVQAETPDCSLSASEIYARTSPSVVQVVSVSINPFLIRDRVAPSIGTGFIVDDGYIVTNYHVVADANETIVFVQDQTYLATIVGIDPTLDVAVLDANLVETIGKPISFTKDTQLDIGQRAFAVGYPLGLGQSISAGVVSGIGRVLQQKTSSWLSPYVQTDAAISPGNSGGPLVDDCGDVIGMITSSISGFGAENIGFAIPSGILQTVTAALIEDGYVSRPWHGLYGQMTTPPVLQLLGIPPQDWGKSTGFLVETIEPGSGGERAGLIGGNLPMMWGANEILLGGDIITHVNGERVNTLKKALDAVKNIRIGETVTLTAIREGSTFETSVVIEERPIMSRELEFYRQPRR